MKRSVYFPLLLLCLSVNGLAQPMFNVPSALSEQASQFMTTLNHFKECVVRKGACTQAEKATIRMSLFFATYILIVGLLAFKMTHTEKQLKGEIKSLADGNLNLFVYDSPLGVKSSGDTLVNRLKKIDAIDYKKKAKELEKLKKLIEAQLKVK